MAELFQVNRADRIMDILFGVAAGGGLIGYGPLAERVGTQPNYLSKPLDQVSRQALDRGEPLWSALVVSKHTGRPNGGFYGLARRLRPEYQTLDDDAIWERERRRCYATAGGHDPNLG